MGTQDVECGLMFSFTVLLSPAPPLTLENILKAVEGVKDMEKLAHKLNGGYVVDSSIKDVVEEFVEGRGHYKRPSWRAVIIALDEAGETCLADQIRHNAEPVQGR